MLRRIFLALVLSLTMLTAIAEGMININTASQEQLASLIGIGESKAAAIIAFRELNGPFPSISALVQVKGIGVATLEKNRDKLTVN